MDGHLARPVGTETPRTISISGTFFEKRRRECDKEIISRVEELARKRGWSMAQVALTWSKAKVTAPIVGANSVRDVASCPGYPVLTHDVTFQVDRVANSIISGKTLTDEEIVYLEAP